MSPIDKLLFSVLSSDFCKENYSTLKYDFSMREFIGYKEGVIIQEFYKAAAMLDQHKEQERLRNK